MSTSNALFISYGANSIGSPEKPVHKNEDNTIIVPFFWCHNNSNKDVRVSSWQTKEKDDENKQKSSEKL